ncbi:hypothetical protein [Burkholderia ambifaria]|uniref:hypothetical protein n=1 Tax=Burkholderia ambifaria TaxID=152480 RepID=UPI001FC8017E|nr:hypothetical protein [Burkholderia ambifaria]
MKHRDDIRFATTGSALRRAGRMRARRLHAGIAPVARAATALRVVVHRSLSLRRVMPLAAARVAIAAPSAGNGVMTAATLACARTVRGAPAFSRRRLAHARAAPFMPSRGTDRFLLFALP